MSDELRDKMAEAMCGASAFGKSFPWPTLSEGDRDAWRVMADAGMAALKASGWEVVKLPDPLEREDGDEFTDFPGAFPYTPVVFDQHPGEVQIRAGAWCDEPLSATEARELGASILAAANAADAADGAR